MVQLSLDGKRLYVSTSLFSSWDKQSEAQLPGKPCRPPLYHADEAILDFRWHGTSGCLRVEKLTISCRN